MSLEDDKKMVKALQALTTLVAEGKLHIDGVTISNSSYEIELGANETFEGDIKFRVTSEYDVIKIGNILDKAIQDLG